MAEVADYYFPGEEDEDEQVRGEIETLDSIHYWSNEFDHDDIYSSDTDSFSPQLSEFVPSDHSVHAQFFVDGDHIEEREACVEIGGSDSDSDSDLNYYNREDQVNLVFNLFERCAEQSQSHVVDNNGSGLNPFSDNSSFRVVDGNDEMGSNLELGLDLGFERQGDEDNDNGGFMIADCGEEFFVGRRASVLESGEPSAIRAVAPFGDGLRVVGIGSDSDEEVEEVVGGIDLHSEFDDDGSDQNPDDLGLPLCWDCLRLEDQRESVEEFEWEEVDERVDEREVLSMVIDPDEERSVSTETQSEEAVEGLEEAMRNIEWEVLLAVNNLGRNPELDHEAEPYLADHDDYMYPAEYVMLFGQFTENESSLKGSPPAAKSFVDNLPSVVLTQEDVQNKNGFCAVCKDEISTEEKAKKLPCSHYYHGDCILPWLKIRNTCPVCRYELPTDDPDYEQRKSQRAGRGLPGDTQVRYNFEIFPEQ